MELLPLRTMDHDRTTGRWQTLAFLVGTQLPFELPRRVANGYITLTREQAQQLRDVLEMDGPLPPFLEADRETVARTARSARIRAALTSGLPVACGGTRNSRSARKESIHAFDS